MKYEYLNSNGTFKLEKADENSYLYFPIGNNAGVMACVRLIFMVIIKLDRIPFCWSR